jgi:hypothetical protein
MRGSLCHHCSPTRSRDRAVSRSLIRTLRSAGAVKLDIFLDTATTLQTTGRHLFHRKVRSQNMKSSLFLLGSRAQGAGWHIIHSLDIKYVQRAIYPARVGPGGGRRGVIDAVAPFRGPGGFLPGPEGRVSSCDYQAGRVE